MASASGAEALGLAALTGLVQQQAENDSAAKPVSRGLTASSVPLGVVQPTANADSSNNKCPCPGPTPSCGGAGAGAASQSAYELDEIKQALQQLQSQKKEAEEHEKTLRTLLADRTGVASIVSELSDEGLGHRTRL